MSTAPIRPRRNEGPRRFVLAVTTLLYAAVALGGIALLLQPRMDTDGRRLATKTTILMTAVAILALVTNIFAWLGTSRGEKMSASVSSTAFAALALFGLWPVGLVVAPFPLLNAIFLFRDR